MNYKELVKTIYNKHRDTLPDRGFKCINCHYAMMLHLKGEDDLVMIHNKNTGNMSCMTTNTGYESYLHMIAKDTLLQYINSNGAITIKNAFDQYPEDIQLPNNLTWKTAVTKRPNGTGGIKKAISDLLGYDSDGTLKFMIDVSTSVYQPSLNHLKVPRIIVSIKDIINQLVDIYPEHIILEDLTNMIIGEDDFKCVKCGQYSLFVNNNNLICVYCTGYLIRCITPGCPKWISKEDNPYCNNCYSPRYTTIKY